MVNTCKEFETLPVSQGDVLVRGPSRPVRGGAPDGPGGALFSLEFSHKINSESLTDWEGPFLIRIF